MIIKKLLARFRVAWVPRLCDLLGFACIIIAVGLVFGIAPLLAVAGVALLAIGWALE